MRKTELGNADFKAWRWNVDPTWGNFSAMIQDDFFARQANTIYDKHRLSKSCLYFAVATVEAFINKELYLFLASQKTEKKEILQILTNAKKRLAKLQETSFSTLYHHKEYKRYEYYKEIRNEATHPVRQDQLIGDYLDIVDTGEIVKLVKYLLIKTCEMQDKVFPYWMLGWNYIGFNFNKMEPFLSNNLNGFYYSLIAMKIEGFDCQYPMSFENKYMKKYEDFLKFEVALAEYPFEVEPASKIFPDKPRLTRKWWDHSVLDFDTIYTCPDDPNNPGWKLGWALLIKSPDQRIQNFPNWACEEPMPTSLGFFDSKEKAEYVLKSNTQNYWLSYAKINLTTFEVEPIQE